MSIKNIGSLVTVIILSSLVATPSLVKAEPVQNPISEMGEQQAANFIPNRNLMHLVKGSGPEVFLIQEGERRWITDSKTFDAYGFIYSEVKGIFDDELTSYKEGTPITKNGTLLQGNNSDEVYIIVNGKRRLVTANVFEKYHFQREDINSVSDRYLLSIPEDSAFQ